MSGMYDLIVFSHLRWNFVWQRPQHLLSRFAQQRRVFVIEEPVLDNEGPARCEISEPQNNVFVCRPLTSNSAAGFCDSQFPDLQQLFPCLLREQHIERYAAWFYTPMAFPLIESLKPLAVIYDCMDELSAFLHAPPELLEREQHLLDRADLVFTGGPSLYE